MRDEIHAYLDGEIGLDELEPSLRAEAERWDALLSAAREAGPSGAPLGLESRVMRALPERRRVPWWRRIADWALRPRPIRVPPIALAGAAAALVLLLLRPWAGPVPTTPGAGPAARATVYVQFMVQAPGASSVAVAGDFTEWSPQLALEDADGDGVWTGRIPLRPGVHEYMFVVDGSEWMTDPNADRYADDGFGNRNAVLVVPEIGSTRS